jgi:hypothetical protein
LLRAEVERGAAFGGAAVFATVTLGASASAADVVDGGDAPGVFGAVFDAAGAVSAVGVVDGADVFGAGEVFDAVEPVGALPFAVSSAEETFAAALARALGWPGSNAFDGNGSALEQAVSSAPSKTTARNRAVLRTMPRCSHKRELTATAQ